MHKNYGKKWAQISNKLPGRTDNNIKNHMNSTMKKEIKETSFKTRYELEKNKYFQMYSQGQGMGLGLDCKLQDMKFFDDELIDRLVILNNQRELSSSSGIEELEFSNVKENNKTLNLYIEKNQDKIDTTTMKEANMKTPINTRNKNEKQMYERREIRGLGTNNNTNSNKSQKNSFHDEHQIEILSQSQSKRVHKYHISSFQDYPNSAHSNDSTLLTYNPVNSDDKYGITEFKTNIHNNFPSPNNSTQNKSKKI